MDADGVSIAGAHACLAPPWLRYRPLHQPLVAKLALERCAQLSAVVLDLTPLLIDHALQEVSRSPGLTVFGPTCAATPPPPIVPPKRAARPESQRRLGSPPG
jgi:hypothetical protein